MKIIFLDIDGVLNSVAWMKAEAAAAGNDTTENTIGWNKVDPAACARLNRIITATGAKIVVSSTWRKMLCLSAIRGVLLGSGVTYPVPIIDKTPVLHKPRGLEIQAWLDEFHNSNLVEDFVILDDDGDMEHLVDKLVQTSCETGLLDEHVDRAIEILERVSA